MGKDKKTCGQSRWHGVVPALCLLASVFVHTAQAQSETQSAWQMVEQLNRQSMELLARHENALKTNPQAVYADMEALVAARFDFERMSKLALGEESWNSGDAGEQARFTKQFAALIVRSYTISLADYTHGSTRIQPFAHLQESRRLMVRTSLRRPGSSLEIPLDYELYFRDGQWKVFNIIIDGISLILNCRRSFSDNVSSEGIGELIKRLEQRTELENRPKAD